MLKGEEPETIEDMLQELGIYFLAHKSDIDIRERSRIFRLEGEEFEDEVDIILHGIAVKDVEKLFSIVVLRLAEETATLAIPDDEDEEGTVSSKSGKS